MRRFIREEMKKIKICGEMKRDVKDGIIEEWWNI